METHTLENLAQRITLLESQNRRLKFAAASAAILIACAGILAANGGRHPREVVAERFVIKDASGRILGALGANHYGNPELALLDDRGNDQIRLSVNADSSSSLEFANRGRIQSFLSSSSDGGSALQLFDNHSRLVTALYAWNGGETGLALNRDDGGLHLGVKPKGDALFQYSDPDGLVRSGWRFHTDGQLLACESQPHPYSSEPSERRRLKPTHPAVVPAAFAPFSIGVQATPAFFSHSPALLP